ncbi:MAG: OmpA family protein [Kiritimatiellaeota bacterium]|nr:OmpA family protein [Kiritimatiellota bacterium]
MNMRFMVAANVALACVLMGVNTGCGPKKGLGVDPAIPTGDILNPPTEWETDDGRLLSGDASHFENMYQRVQGVEFAPVYFAFDSYALAPQEMAKIDQVARHLQANNNHVLVVEGHCDIRGSNEYNLALGENRALAVRTHLANLGIGPERIQSRSYGSEKPAVAGTGEAVWRLNRRGEFALYQK